jgi:methyltransferase
MIPLAALAVVVALMLVELTISRRNERTMQRLGAIAPPDPVYGTMKWAYPGVFVAMALEGLWRDQVVPPIDSAEWIGSATSGVGLLVWSGAAVFVAAKLLKGWAIASLGHRWTYGVLVLPNAPLVTTGPYRLMRHPNYVGVVGELIAMALVTNARIAGSAGLLFFGYLLLLRIRAEERALRPGRQSAA